MVSLKDKVTLVTGGANGIGANIVREFLKEGVKHIAILDIDEVSGVTLEKEINSKYGEAKTKFYKCNVTNDEELFAVYDKTMKTFGVIDVVVNNAGIACDAPSAYKKEIDVNFVTTVTSTLKALQLMRVDEGGKGGTIINISSVAALSLYAPNIFIYGATKSAILHLSSTLGREEYYCHTKVRVITVCFGVTDTDLSNSYLQCIDKLSTDFLNSNIKRLKEQGLSQSAEVAAKGLVTSFKNGKSGSIWQVEHNETNDISKNVNEAYDIMSTITKYKA